MSSGPVTSWQIDEETMETVTGFILLGSKITEDGDAAMKIKDPCSWKKSYDQPRQHIKKQRHHFANKSLYSQRYGFFSSQIWMWELNYKEYQRIDAFELWCWIKLSRVP